MMQPRATYVYCLVAAEHAPELGEVPAGLEGMQPPRLLEAGQGLWAVVADAPLDRYSAEAIESGLADVDWVGCRAMEHERVVEHFLEAQALVPMKLFTLFTSDERALADLDERRDEIESVLRAIEGRREWGVRVLHDRQRAIESQREQRPQPEATPREALSGTAFLQRKQRERQHKSRLSAEARERGAALFAELATRADDTRRREPAPGEPVGRLVLDAAFLLPAERGPAFRALVERHKVALAAEGYELLLTGPWPAYHFIV